MPQNSLTRVSDTTGENLARHFAVGLGVVLVWLWCGFGVALVGPWCGFGGALVWLCTPESMPSICLLYGFAVALGGLSVQGSGFRVQGPMLDVRCWVFFR